MDTFNQANMELQEGDCISMGNKVFSTNKPSYGKFVAPQTLPLEVQIACLTARLDALYNNKLIRFILWLGRMLG